MRLLGLLTKAWMEGFYSPLLWPAERQNSVLLALCLSLSLILYIPELSDPLPWLSPNSSNQGGLPYSWVGAAKSGFKVLRPSHFSLVPAFQPFLCADTNRQVVGALHRSLAGVQGFLNCSCGWAASLNLCPCHCHAAFPVPDRANGKLMRAGTQL